MTMVEQVATAIANRRAGRHGAPAVSNVLELLKSLNGGTLYDEVMDDARAAIQAMREPTEQVAAALDLVPGGWGRGAWQQGIDAALAD